jgi:hypothetical protein
MILGPDFVAVRVFLSPSLIRIRDLVGGWIKFGLSRVSEISISRCLEFTSSLDCGLPICWKWGEELNWYRMCSVEYASWIKYFVCCQVTRRFLPLISGAPHKVWKLATIVRDDAQCSR